MIKLSIPEMSCGHCKSSIEKAVAAVDTDAEIEVDLENRTVSIKSSLDEAALIDAIKEGGYESSPV